MDWSMCDYRGLVEVTVDGSRLSWTGRGYRGLVDERLSWTGRCKVIVDWSMRGYRGLVDERLSWSMRGYRGR